MSDTIIPSQKIERKTKLAGKVIKTTLAGIIVDVGLEKPGVVHIAHMSAEPVKRVEDVVNVGDEVEAWVRREKKGSKHIELTMIEPLALEWGEIKKGMVISGEVVRLEKFGAFIEIGAERPGLAHISELTHEYIRRPDDAVKVGEEVQVKVLDYSRKKKQIKLSMKALQESPEQAVEEYEKENNAPVLTAMEIAYRKALDVESDEEGAVDALGNEEQISTEQDDIITRTLKQKAANN